MKKLGLFLVALFLIFSAEGKALKGAYTIDPSGSGSTNFKSFTDAIAALTKDGVRGTVTFNIADGTYNEAISIGYIKNASRFHQIIFQSSSLDSTKVTLNSSNSDQTVILNGCSWVTFRKMTITYTAGSITGDVMQFASCDHVTIENNILHYIKGKTVPYHEAVLDGDYPDNDYNVVRHNHIIGGYWGIEHDPNGYVQTNNKIYENVIDSVTHCGLNIHYQAGLSIYNNRIHLLQSGSYGIILTNTTRYDDYGVSYIYNNFVTVKSGTAAKFVDNESLNIFYNDFVNLSNDYTMIFDNTITKASVNFKDNIVSNLGGGIAMYVNAPVRFTSNYNDLYTTGGTLGSWKSTACTALSDWQSASAQDNNSVSGNPNLNDVSINDLHGTSSSKVISHAGVYLRKVDVDIDGDARKSKPDIGADEFSFPDSNDVGVTAIYLPSTGTCGPSAISVKVKVHNFGYQDQTNNFRIYTSVSGAVSASVVQNFTGTLFSGMDTTLDVVFTPSLNAKLGGSYTFTSYTVIAADFNNKNDTSTATDSFYNYPKAGFAPAPLICISDTFNFINTSVGAATQLWSFGDAMSSTAAKPSHHYSGVGIYTVKLSVASSHGCTDTFYRTVKVDSCFNTISGMITTSKGVSLGNSNVYAIKYDSADTIINVVAHTTTDTGGNYAFNHLMDSVIYLIALPDSSNFPSEVATWRDTSLTFQHAKAVRIHFPSNQTINFHTLAGANNSNTGIVSGKVYLCALCKTSGGVPAAGVKLLLVDKFGVCHGISYTDVQGNFTFKNVEIMEYHIWVDKPGIDNFVSPKVTLSSNQVTKENLKLTLYPSYLSEDVTTSINQATEVNDALSLSIYPNPFSQQTNIHFGLAVSNQVSVEVFDVLGKSVCTLMSGLQPAGEYNLAFNPSQYHLMAKGIFIVKVNIGGIQSTKQIIAIN